MRTGLGQPALAGRFPHLTLAAILQPPAQWAQFWKTGEVHVLVWTFRSVSQASNRPHPPGGRVVRYYIILARGGCAACSPPYLQVSGPGVPRFRLVCHWSGRRQEARVVCFAFARCQLSIAESADRDDAEDGTDFSRITWRSGHPPGNAPRRRCRASIPAGASASSPLLPIARNRPSSRPAMVSF